MFGMLCLPKKKNSHAETKVLPPNGQLVREAKMKFRYANGDQPLNGFTIKRGVGVGGFGEVYFALNDAGKEVALKQIQRNLDVEVRGVRQCMNLKHPNLISLFDVRFDQNEQGWIVMEYVSGLSLRDLVDAHPRGVPGPEMMRWFGQIASGVAYLHDHGIVHRDLKPANIFEDEGLVKIGDYGLSKYISSSRRGGQTESVGTFHYMAPEIGKGEYGKEVDIYALGVILYEMATGTVPFDGESSQEIIMKHLTATPDLSAVPSPLREVIACALAKNPASRFSDVRQMLRPLGMDIDDRGLLVQGLSPSQPPATPAPGPSQAWFQTAQAPPPVAAAAGAEPNSAVHQLGMGGNYPPAASPAYTSTFQEPIARTLSMWISSISAWYRNDLSVGTRNIVLAVGIVMLILNSGFVIAAVVLGLLFYLPYYVLWRIIYASPRPEHPGVAQRRWHKLTSGHAVAQRAAQQAPAQPASKMQRFKPMSARQWRLAQRHHLAQLSSSGLWAQITASWLNAALVIAVFSYAVGLFMVSGSQPLQPVAMNIIWTAVVSLVAALIIICLGKYWQSREGDWPLRSFIQLLSGFAVGGIAYVLAGYLLMNPGDTSGPASLTNAFQVQWPGADRPQWANFANDNQVLLLGYMAYFPLLMGLVGWWKQVDPLRRVRFSIWAVTWSVLVASLIQQLVPFPQPWCALLAGGTSIAVQLASPWISSDERLAIPAPQHLNR
ncbi:MAG: serine/threonine protein kinase [Pirellulaceae bacterium]|nr:serine/threonine protein kinase [Pirellulaceae bacterium]